MCKLLVGIPWRGVFFVLFAGNGRLSGKLQVFFNATALSGSGSLEVPLFLSNYTQGEFDNIDVIPQPR